MKKSHPKRRHKKQAPAAQSHKQGWAKQVKWIAGSIGLLIGMGVTVFLCSHKTPDSSPPNPAQPASSLGKDEGVQADDIDSVLSRKAETVTEIQAEGLQLAQRMVAAFPNQTQALLLLGNVYRQRGDFTKNLELTLQALVLNPQQTELYEQLGQAAYENGEREQALAYWKQGLDIDPNAPNLRWLIAQICVEQGQHEQAIDLLTRECAITPDSSRNYYLLGQVYLQLKAYEQAKVNYTRATELSPAHYNAYFGLANACMRLKERDNAAEYMNTFKELKQKFDESGGSRVHVDEIGMTREHTARFYLQAYNIYKQAGQASKAEDLLLRACQLDPQYTGYLENLAAHYYRDNRVSDALNTYIKANKVDPNQPLFYVNIAKLYTELRQFTQAQKTFENTIKRFPDYGLGYAEFARLYLHAQKNPAQAMALASRAAALDPVASNYVLLSWAYSVAGDNQAALTAAEKAVALAPDNPDYRRILEQVKAKQSFIGPK